MSAGRPKCTARHSLQVWWPTKEWNYYNYECEVEGGGHLQNFGDLTGDGDVLIIFCPGLGHSPCFSSQAATVGSVAPLIPTLSKANDEGHRSISAEECTELGRSGLSAERPSPESQCLYRPVLRRRHYTGIPSR